MLIAKKTARGANLTVKGEVYVKEKLVKYFGFIAVCDGHRSRLRRRRRRFLVTTGEYRWYMERLMVK